MSEQREDHVVDTSKMRRDFKRLFLDEQQYILTGLKRESKVVEPPEQEANTPESLESLDVSSSPNAYAEQINNIVKTFGSWTAPQQAEVETDNEGPPEAAGTPDTQDSNDETAADDLAAQNTAEPTADANIDGLDDERLRFVEARTLNEEPFVSFHATDQTGIAFSGGGIRSATFNLGVLQGLHDLGLLHLFDYMSTVSGGGYIGSWWTAWRHRSNAKNEYFPTPAEQKPQYGDDAQPTQEAVPRKLREAEEIRHLREFSNFLTPRLGFFSTDMWVGVVSIVSGMLPTLLMAFCLLVMAITGFIFVGSLLLGPVAFVFATVPIPIISMVTMMVVTALVVFVLENTWRDKFRFTTQTVDFSKDRYGKNAVEATVIAVTLTAFAAIFTMRSESTLQYQVLQLGTQQDATSSSTLNENGELKWILPDDFLSNSRTWAAQPKQDEMGLNPDESAANQAPPAPVDDANPTTSDGENGQASGPEKRVAIGDGVELVIDGQSRTSLATPNLRLFLPSIVWLATCVLMIVNRYYADWSSDRADNRTVLAASSRCMGRLGKIAIVWALFATIWELSRLLDNFVLNHLFATGGGLAVALELFRRSTGMLTQTASQSETPSILSSIKSLLPQILAYSILAVILVLLCQCAHHLLNMWGLWLIAMIGLGASVILLVECVLVNPETLGLHAFYRDRLARAYLGASNPELIDKNQQMFAFFNRQTMPHEHDDFPLGQVLDGTCEGSEKLLRPYHLICCAANDIATDHVSDLGRGARSATLSPLGLAIGNHAASQPDLTLSTAMTASAAAFNSNMGSVTMKLGPVVTFLLTAINLRLGIWRRHPSSTKWDQEPTFPGLRLLQEMLSATSAGFRGKQLESPDVHLSDGAHFENLALYELVRRHCRYIIVSDCGADPEVAFDDFGNALRRIREDFGVEIEIDMNRLVANEDRLAAQHMAVGTIHYDRKNDKGILLYFKPNLTGDEPDDVKQYRTRNDQFPNETTVDQFYDEAQWESYRRLGEHAARSALRFCEAYSAESKRVPQQVFSEAFRKYYPTPAGLQQAVTLHTERFSTFQHKLRTERGSLMHFVAEICPELEAFDKDETKRPQMPPTNSMGPLLILLTEMTQMMEDAYSGCQLATHASHPLNLGWMNLFQRWANAPTFRTWWPILQPLYGQEFRTFMNREIGLSDRAPGEMSAEQAKQFLQCHSTDDAALTSGMAYKQFERELLRVPGGKPVPKHNIAYSLHLPLVDRHTETTLENAPKVQVAVCFVNLDQKVASWQTDDLYVPPGLWGTGIGTVFLRAICDHLESDQQVQTCEVRTNDEQHVDSKLKESNESARASHSALLRFYTAVGFHLRLQDDRQILKKEFSA